MMNSGLNSSSDSNDQEKLPLKLLNATRSMKPTSPTVWMRGVCLKPQVLLTLLLFLSTSICLAAFIAEDMINASTSQRSVVTFHKTAEINKKFVEEAIYKAFTYAFSEMARTYQHPMPYVRHYKKLVLSDQSAIQLLNITYDDNERTAPVKITLGIFNAKIIGISANQFHVSCSKQFYTILMPVAVTLDDKGQTQLFGQGVTESRLTCRGQELFHPQIREQAINDLEMAFDGILFNYAVEFCQKIASYFLMLQNRSLK